MTESKIVIVCALKEEFAAVEAGLGANYRERFELIRAGVGHVSALRVARDLAVRPTPPEFIVSTGFCGGIADGLNVGDIVYGYECCSEHYRLDFDGVSARAVDWTVHTNQCFKATDLLERLKCEWGKSQTRSCFGKMAAANRAVATIDEKRRRGESTKAIAVDMETYALVGASDSRSNVMFIRVVSDAIGDELPAEVGEFLNEKGDVRIGKIARFILKNPFNIKRLMELKKRSDIAAKALTQAWSALRDVSFE